MKGRDMSRRALTGILVVLSLTTASGQQTREPAALPTPQPPTFKVEVEYVEVDVQVTDSKGNFVRDLTKEDFQIVEDGTPQTIDAFSLIDIPIDPPRQPVSGSVQIAPDVTSNERPFDGRVYVMILDDMGTAFDRTTRTKNAARQFIEQHLRTNDLMAIVFTWKSEPAQEFTSDKRLLLAAVDKFMGAGGTASEAPLPLLSPVSVASESLFTLGNNGAGAGGNALTGTLRDVLAWLGRQTLRRTAVILVSDGAAGGSANIMRLQESLTLDNLTTGRLGAANVSIYGVDMRGPGTVQLPLDQLTSIAEANGGFVVMDNPEIGRGFDRLVAENSTYYLLSYYASHPGDSRVHSINVRVKRPGVRVRSRQGYTSRLSDVPASRTPGDTQASPMTIAALRSPTQRSDLRMRVFAAPFRGPSNASVLLGIDLVGAGLPLDSDGPVEISYVAVDTKDKEHGWRTDRFSLNLQPDTRTRVERNGVSVLKRMELPPGRYRLHVAASAPDRNRAGSVLHDLEVPDFKKAGLAMSGVLLMSKSRAHTLIAHADEQAKSILPGPPTATRTFPRDDEIAVFAEVYATKQPPSDEVNIVTTARSDAGEVVFEKTETLRSSKLEGGYRHVVHIPLQAFEPGAFILSVEAKSKRKPNSAKTVHQLPFTVTAADPAR
jgi:VWFA-related protein